MTTYPAEVCDLPLSIEFYRRAFGWPQTVKVPTYAEFATPGDLRIKGKLKEFLIDFTVRWCSASAPTTDPETIREPMERRRLAG